MRIVGEVNKYVSEQAPWKLKDDRDRQGTVLHVTLQAVSDCNTMLTPFLPHSANKVHLALSTHSEGGLTNLDFQLAVKIDTLAE